MLLREKRASDVPQPLSGNADPNVARRATITDGRAFDERDIAELSVHLGLL
jgi:hypothetical protein